MGGRGRRRSMAQQQLLPVLLLLLAAAAVRLCACQAEMPFLGSGDDDPGNPTDVYVSVFLDRLLGVDDKAYTFEAVVFFYLSWVDPRVKSMVADNAAKLEAPNSTYTCTTPCNSNMKALGGGCCDGVWTPYIAFTNVKYLPQDRLVRYGLGFDPTSDYVFQWSSVHAVWYTPMDLHAFPFDTQRLLVQMEVPESRAGWSGSLIKLLPSAAGEKLFSSKTVGDELSGWTVREIKLVPFFYPLCQRFTASASQPSAPKDPAPLIPGMFWQAQSIQHNPSLCNRMLMDSPSKQHSVFWWKPVYGSEKGHSIQVSGLNCVIAVRRLHERWVLSGIFPIVATTWLGFLVFFLPRDDMNARLGAIVALFLALAAIQFVIDDDLPQSSYVTPFQQLTVTSYATLLLVGAECVLIWWVTAYHVEKKRLRRHLQARKEYDDRLAATLGMLRTRLELMDKWMDADGSGAGSKSFAVNRHMRSMFATGSRSMRDISLRSPPSSAGSSRRWPMLSAASAMLRSRKGSMRGSGGVPAKRVSSAGGPSKRAGNQGPVAGLNAQRLDSGDLSGLGPQRSVTWGTAAAAASPAAAAGPGPGPQPSVATGISSLRSSIRKPHGTAAAGSSGGGGASSSGGSDGGGRVPSVSAFAPHAGAAIGSQRAQQQPGGSPNPSPQQLGQQQDVAIDMDAPLQQQTDAAASAAISRASSDGWQPASPPAASASAAAGSDRSGPKQTDSAKAADSAAASRWCLPATWVAKLKLYRRALAKDEGFADREAHLLNKWCGIVQWMLYNIAVILIFTINTLQYRDVGLRAVQRSY